MSTITPKLKLELAKLEQAAILDLFEVEVN